MKKMRKREIEDYIPIHVTIIHTIYTYVKIPKQNIHFI